MERVLLLRGSPVLADSGGFHHFAKSRKIEPGTVADQGSLADAFPYSLADGSRSWKVETVRLDASLHEPDLGVTYESVGSTDPAVARTEAMAVLSAVLKAQPGLRQNFHGMWAYASKDGKITPVIELPMGQIHHNIQDGTNRRTLSLVRLE